MLFLVTMDGQMDGQMDESDFIGRSQTNVERTTLNEKYNLLYEYIIYIFDKITPIHEISSRHEKKKRKP